MVRAYGSRAYRLRYLRYFFQFPGYDASIFPVARRSGLHDRDQTAGRVDEIVDAGRSLGHRYWSAWSLHSHCISASIGLDVEAVPHREVLGAVSRLAVSQTPGQNERKVPAVGSAFSRPPARVRRTGITVKDCRPGSPGPTCLGRSSGHRRPKGVWEDRNSPPARRERDSP
jgi:hypothetical protein